MFDHTTVLKDEMIEKLSVKSDGTYIDCTVGGGGHSAKIAENLSEKGTLVAIDQDKTALHAAENVLRKIKEDIIFVRSEERRAGKECRCRRGWGHRRKKRGRKSDME